MSIYLDNAATTPLDPEVFEVMEPYLKDQFGNPSSTHAHGRQAKSAIEFSRKEIAGLLNCSTSEIFFTSGGTEGSNTILRGAVATFDIRNIITSPTEHHAVLHTIEDLANDGKLNVTYLDVDNQGHISLHQLEELLKDNSGTLVSIMHANNEIGTLTNVERMGEICKEHKALFHSDAVQAVAHYRHDLSKLKIDGMVASAHKFHGPKGTGFMYINKGCRIKPFIQGGPQEREMRAGTENVAGIAGLAKAMDIAYRDMEKDSVYILGLKNRMVEKLKSSITGVQFSGDLKDGLYTVLNISLPASEAGDMVLFNLDLAGISASGGSACSAGATTSSHVMEAIGSDPQRTTVRFSFSKFNTEEEIDSAAEQLAILYSTN